MVSIRLQNRPNRLCSPERPGFERTQIKWSTNGVTRSSWPREARICHWFAMIRSGSEDMETQRGKSHQKSFLLMTLSSLNSFETAISQWNNARNATGMCAMHATYPVTLYCVTGDEFWRVITQIDEVVLARVNLTRFRRGFDELWRGLDELWRVYTIKIWCRNTSNMCFILSSVTGWREMTRSYGEEWRIYEVRKA